MSNYIQTSVVKCEYTTVKCEYTTINQDGTDERRNEYEHVPRKEEYIITLMWRRSNARNARVGVEGEQMLSVHSACDQEFFYV